MVYYSSCGSKPVHYTQVVENEFLWLKFIFQPLVNPTPAPPQGGGETRQIRFVVKNQPLRYTLRLPSPLGRGGGGVGTAEQNVTFKATIQRLTHSKNFNQLGSPAGGWVDTRPKKLNSTDVCVMDRLKAVGRVRPLRASVVKKLSTKSVSI